MNTDVIYAVAVFGFIIFLLVFAFGLAMTSEKPKKKDNEPMFQNYHSPASVHMENARIRIESLEIELAAQRARTEDYRNRWLQLTAKNIKDCDDYNKLVERYNILVRAYNGGARGSSSLPQELVNKLIRLCHPDKHGNSQLSNEVTKRLLEMRK